MPARIIIIIIIKQGCQTKPHIGIPAKSSNKAKFGRKKTAENSSKLSKKAKKNSSKSSSSKNLSKSSSSKNSSKSANIRSIISNRINTISGRIQKPRVRVIDYATILNEVKLSRHPKNLVKRGTLSAKYKPNPTMNNNGVPVTISSKNHPSDQVITSAATSKAARPNRPPPTLPAGLTKATTEPPGPSSRPIS